MPPGWFCGISSGNHHETDLAQPLRPIWLMIGAYHETDLSHTPPILSSVLFFVLSNYYLLPSTIWGSAPALSGFHLMTIRNPKRLVLPNFRDPQKKARKSASPQPQPRSCGIAIFLPFCWSLLPWGWLCRPKKMPANLAVLAHRPGLPPCQKSQLYR